MKEFNPEKNIKDKNERASYYLNRLKFILDDYSDEIPLKKVHSKDEDNKYKVRAAWWTSVSLVMFDLKRHKLIPNEYGEEYDKITLEHQKDLDENDLTKAGSIEAINDFIKRVIKYLEDQLKK